jgi:hypothetical protein
LCQAFFASNNQRQAAGIRMSVKKVLVLAANPIGTTRLRLDQEVREISTGLQRAKKRELFDLEQRWAVRTRDLRQALLDIEPQVVHFSGHGSSTGGLFLENEVGEYQLVTPEALARLFELFSSHIECVVLNACYSEIQADAIAQHINYVIGMNQAIGDKAAIEFAIGFYDALGAGRDIKDAYKFGCNAIELEGISEYLTPTLKPKDINEKTVFSAHWNNEAYVSLHLVQKVLEEAGLPRKGLYSHWYPQFKIRAGSPRNNGVLKETVKPVDFLIEDFTRNISFLIEVKTANNQINDKARFQLQTYLQYSNFKHGFLIDPFLIEAYQWDQGRLVLQDSFRIKNPEYTQPLSDFLRSFLDSISHANNCDSHV